MKKKYLFYITVLSVILSVTLAGSLTISQACHRERIRVFFRPNHYVWGEPPADPWRAYIKAGWKWTWQIDPSTILLEGVLKPEYTRKWHFIFVAYFDGEAVKNILASKMVHISTGKYVVELTISGNLKSGTPFEGTGIITVTVPYARPP